MKNCVTGKEGPLKVVEAKICDETLTTEGSCTYIEEAQCAKACVSKHGTSAKAYCNYVGGCSCTYICN